MNDQSPRKVFEKAIALLKTGGHQEAEALVRDALERDPGDINFVSLLGSILAERGELQEAAQLLGRAVRGCAVRSCAVCGCEVLGSAMLSCPARSCRAYCAW